MLLTFITVTISAWRVSRLNIVAAIRDLPDQPRARGGLVADFVRPFRILASAFRGLFRFRIRRAFGDLLWRGPRASLTFWWDLFKSGPLTILLGAFFTLVGFRTEQAFPFTLGVSLVLLGLGLTLTWALAPLKLRKEARDRIGFSFAGISMVVYWSLPFDALERFGIPPMKSGMEMFFLSGMMMVLGAVLAVIYNSVVFVALLTAALGRIGRLAPVIKTAVAYPMSFKFRTGLTLSMFALIIFTMVFMSVLIHAMTGTFEDRTPMSGGYQLRGTVSYNNPITDMNAAIAGASGLNRSDFAAIGGQAGLGAQVRQPDSGNPAWETYLVQLLDGGFLDSNEFRLATRARGYETDRDIWRALKDNPGLAVIDTMAVPARKSNSIVIGAPTFKLSGVYTEDKTMDPIDVLVRDPFAGRETRLTIIGVLDGRSFARGIHTSQATAAKWLPVEMPLTTYLFKLRPGVDATATAHALGSAFLQNGMEATLIDDQIDESLSASVSITGLLQGFMGLGLLVGIAALGVISTRSVVERRQQIGMLRAIGYKRWMVQLSFLLESSFIALLGIVLGVALGFTLSYNLIASLAKTQPGVEFAAPWTQIVLIVLIGYVASLLTTYLPARQAARIYPAEALRYE